MYQFDYYDISFFINSIKNPNLGFNILAMTTYRSVPGRLDLLHIISYNPSIHLKITS